MGMNTKALSIQIDDGLTWVPITNMHGEEIGVFKFRPTDVGIVKRYEETMAKMDAITEPLEKIGIAADGTAADGSTADEIEALKEAEKRLYEACDYMFGGNMSEAFFGKMNPFSPIGGRFYCELAIEAVGNLIDEQFDAETKRTRKHIDKYTKGLK